MMDVVALKISEYWVLGSWNINKQGSPTKRAQGIGPSFLCSAGEALRTEALQEVRLGGWRSMAAGLHMAVAPPIWFDTRVIK